MNTAQRSTSTITVRLSAETQTGLNDLVEHFNDGRHLGPPLNTSDVIRFAITALVERELS